MPSVSHGDVWRDLRRCLALFSGRHRCKSCQASPQIMPGVDVKCARHCCKLCKAFPTEQCQYFQENVNETKNAVNDVRKAVRKKTVNRKLGKDSHLSH